MKKLLFIILATIIMLSSCVSLMKTSTDSLRDANMLDDAAYVETEYAKSSSFYINDEPYIATIAILSSGIINSFYAKAISSFELGDVIGGMKQLQTGYDYHMSVYTNQWSSSIGNTYASDFSTALAILKKELKRKEVFNNIEKAFSLLTKIIKDKDKTKYQKTLECYSLMAQYKDAVTDPSGSFMTYSSLKSNLNSEFSKLVSLAAIE